MKQVLQLLILSSLLATSPMAWSWTAFEDVRHAHTDVAPGAKVAYAGMRLAGILPQDGEAMYELEFWNSIKNSNNAEDYEAYLEVYPDGRFAPLARVRAERYRDEAEPVETEPLPAGPTQAATEPRFEIEELRQQYRAVTNTNVRSAPSTEAEKLGVLDQGSRVEVTGRVKDRNWYRIDHGPGGVGFVYAPLLKEAVRAVESEPAPKTEPSEKTPPKSDTPRVSGSPQTTEGGSFKDCPSCPEMIPIPPGRFIMGDDKGDRSERPAHRVTIADPYAIGKFEVTVRQWRECVEAGACRGVSDAVTTSDHAPVRDVSWDDARDYATWLSGITGETYRLPTEAEWEHAARAGTTTTYWWGDRMQPGKANCKDCGNPWNYDLPAEVGSFEANPYGLHDMNGNVWEWVSDCWHRNYRDAPTDGSSWNDKNCTVRVIRGGSWRNDKTYVHSASRFKYDAYVRYLLNGFRVVKTLD